MCTCEYGRGLLLQLIITPATHILLLLMFAPSPDPLPCMAHHLRPRLLLDSFSQCLVFRSRYLAISLHEPQPPHSDPLLPRIPAVNRTRRTWLIKGKLESRVRADDGEVLALYALYPLPNAQDMD